MRIYIAGRVTGIPRADVERNFARGFKLLLAKGHRPVTPLDHAPPLASSSEAMKILVPLLLGCDGILLLNDWRFSEGAKIEASLARYTGMKVFEEDNLT